MNDRILICCESERKSGPYLRALVSMGVVEDRLQVLTPNDVDGNSSALAQEAAGLVICGGPDVDPNRYGEQPRGNAKLELMPELDTLEWDLLRGAHAGRTPVWGICRGLQTFNAFQGGTLWQDLPSQVAGPVDHDPEGPDNALVHSVKVINRWETFGDLLDGDGTEVNSRHHQAIKKLGRGILPVAVSADGIIEVAALQEDGWWVKGVQWHPENLVHLPLQRQLWLEFVTIADGKASSGSATKPSSPRGR